MKQLCNTWRNFHAWNLTVVEIKQQESIRMQTEIDVMNKKFIGEHKKGGLAN